MAYKVTTNFFDTEDNKRLYEVGQTYPRAGFEASQDRIDYLLNKNNDFKNPFIKFIEDEVVAEEYPKHTGGGFYELSNGEHVKGKSAAIKAENKLKSGE